MCLNRRKTIFCHSEMPIREKKSEIPEIQSDDEISDSEPMNEIDKFHENVDHDSGEKFGFLNVHAVGNRIFE